MITKLLVVLGVLVLATILAFGMIMLMYWVDDKLNN